MDDTPVNDELIHLDKRDAAATQHLAAVALRTLAQRLFLSPDGSNAHILIEYLREAVDAIIGRDGAETSTYRLLQQPQSQIGLAAAIPQTPTDVQLLLRDLGGNTLGSVAASDPYVAKNVFSLPAFPSVATNAAAGLLMANGVSGEDSGLMLNAEIACAGALAKVVGYDPALSRGVFTFGGTATNMYGAKLGLLRVAPNHQKEGVPSDVCFVTPKAAHYSHDTAAAWLGVGTNNIMRVATNENQTTDLGDLRSVLRSLAARGRRIATIFVSGGTTSNCAMDDVGSVAAIRDELVAEFRLAYAPHIHLDSVLGWAFATFSSYNPLKNELAFTDRVLEQIHRFQLLTATFRHADSLGIDLHKTGFAAYNSSMFIVKDGSDLGMLARSGATTSPLFHDDQAYNPGRITLETSRSAASILATWVGLQAIGIEGFWRLLGSALENGWILRDEIAKLRKGFFAINQDPFGCDVFVRCYASDATGADAHRQERNDDAARKRNSEYLARFHRFLSRERKSGKGHFEVSLSSAAFYLDGTEPLPALRIYCLNPYATAATSRELVLRLREAKQVFDEGRDDT
jgi:glutamate/tyrosine decarboxylase-like PLP-dependent enzyme